MSDVDDLFDYDVGLDEVLKNLPTVQNNDASNASKDIDLPDSGAVLGLDADLKVTKQRAPVAKLDAARLLSQNGIPKLRKNARSKLRLKGKGHEFSDLGRLLNFYQLWLDDLYPRAKFADGLAMIEKLGHTKRVQIMRKEWIDEDKPDLKTYTSPSQTSSNEPENTRKEDGPGNDIDDLLAELEGPEDPNAL
ncbi:replication fork protection component Swi3-domain-containing protein [Talaromyces proteolyticus]|uniref:Chromosome segregation in meiosis protein n=1 Tax=Talaromyces proteolyticus TaxID=1131652 RepID=A0AAD4KK09_9EURO|nr:replication fork protection component Swi3-domain-containing protein [Talaromyces proteolyticus]KAH8690977.1 replication fork protection component Swi3-domain-containing protein [Talaromyces proteolyticus]